MGREAGIVGDIDDHRLQSVACGPPASGSVIPDDGEVIEELAAKPALDGDPEASIAWVSKLDVAEVPADQ